MLTIGSLFSGIGGLDIGLEWAGLGPVIWQCEIDPFCRAVLAKHWPKVTRFDDVTQPRDWPKVDLICGGFPCTDVSSAGKRRGLGGDNSGLWWHFANVVRIVQPRVVVVENVASGAKKWLRPVRHQLHMLGYRTRALGISTADVGAPHLRKRVFVVAYADGLSSGESSRSQMSKRAANVDRKGEPAQSVDAEVARASPTSSDVDRQRGRTWLLGPSPWAKRQGRTESVGGLVANTDGDSVWEQSRRCVRSGWQRETQPEWAGGRFAQPDVLRVSDGLSRGLDSPRRRIRALGNAVVPQCSQVVGEVIKQMLRDA